MLRVCSGCSIIKTGVICSIREGFFTVKGPLDSLSMRYPVDQISLEIKDSDGLSYVLVKSPTKSKSFVGTYTALINNMISGVCKYFEKTLEIRGVGYRVFLEGDDMKLFLGYSNSITLSIPKGLKVKIEKSLVRVLGCDKCAVGQFAANIRRFRPVSPYKGKGIRYSGEHVILKEGKK